MKLVLIQERERFSRVTDVFLGFRRWAFTLLKYKIKQRLVENICASAGGELNVSRIVDARGAEAPTVGPPTTHNYRDDV